MNGHPDSSTTINLSLLGNKAQNIKGHTTFQRKKSSQHFSASAFRLLLTLPNGWGMWS